MGPSLASILFLTLDLPPPPGAVPVKLARSLSPLSMLNLAMICIISIELIRKLDDILCDEAEKVDSLLGGFFGSFFPKPVTDK